VQRAKEIARNKKERKFLRDAHKMKSDPNALKEELKEVTTGNLLVPCRVEALSAWSSCNLLTLAACHAAIHLQVLELEEDGKLNMTVRLKKRALQGAYDQAIKKKKVRMPRSSFMCRGLLLSLLSSVMDSAKPVMPAIFSHSCLCPGRIGGKECHAQRKTD
jgi:hypothetical protein